MITETDISDRQQRREHKTAMETKQENNIQTTGQQ